MDLEAEIRVLKWMVEDLQVQLKNHLLDCHDEELDLDDDEPTYDELGLHIESALRRQDTGGRRKARVR